MYAFFQKFTRIMGINTCMTQVYTCVHVSKRTKTESFRVGEGKLNYKVNSLQRACSLNENSGHKSYFCLLKSSPDGNNNTLELQ